MKKKFIIISDLDGTIIPEFKDNSSQEISSDVYETFLKIKNGGNKIIFATGRRPWNTKDIPDNLLSIADTLILANGAVILTKGKYDYNWISEEKIKVLFKYLNYSDINYYIDTEKATFSRYLMGNGDWTLSIDKAVFSIRLSLVDTEIISNLISIVNTLDLSLISWSNGEIIYIEILERGIDKWASSLKSIEEDIIGNSQIVGIGNDINDLKLLINADISIGVGNNPVINIFSKIRSTNEEELVFGLKKLLEG